MAIVTWLTVAAAVGSGLIGGFFFAFSAVVMNALGRLPPERGIGAMQSINIVVLNAWFFIAFFGTAVLCLILGGWSVLNWHLPQSLYLLVASVFYIVGVIVVTMTANVPLNNELAAVETGDSEGERSWKRYLSVWTAWNHVRTVAPLLASLLFILAT